MAGGRSALLRAALAAGLLMSAASRLTSPRGAAPLASWLNSLLRDLRRVDEISSAVSPQEPAKRSDSQTFPIWHKRSDHVTSDNDTDGVPFNSTDYNNAMKHDVQVDEIKIPDNVLEDGTFDDIRMPLMDEQIQNNAINDGDERWPDAQVPYTIASGFSSSDRATIASGILQLERSTCVRLRARNNADRHYVRIIRGSGCFSSVGRQQVGGQELSLGNGCLYPGIVAHELMHAVGFWHEQSRPDRDRHVYIHYDNIKSGASSNFHKYTWSEVRNLSEPYDLVSIMHYGKYAFARNRNRPTITALVQPSDQMGQRHSLSPIDIRKINKLYECGGGTGTVTPDKCKDKNVNCAAWADAGECKKNPRYMLVHCALSCKTCSEQLECVDKNKHCRAWAASGECQKNPNYMEANCRKACCLCPGGDSDEDCIDKNKHCQAWAESGECEANPDYMLQSCRKACKKCCSG